MPKAIKRSIHKQLGKRKTNRYSKPKESRVIRLGE